MAQCGVQSESVMLQSRTLTKQVTEDPASPILGTQCRFATSSEWDDLATNPETQDQYVAAVLRWDGRFASPGNAVSTNGLTKDHITLNDDGSKKEVAGYTAPSKENLHLSMLAKIVDGHPLAWNFVIAYALQNSGLSAAEQDALTEDQLKAMGEEEALRRLDTIIGEYDRYREDCPGCGGFINWAWVGESGFEWQPGKKVKGIPALDNGQNAWAMIAVAQVLGEKGHTDLAARYQTQIDVMKAEAAKMFFNGKRCAMVANVKDKKKAAGAKLKQKGQLRDPFEGELMIMFMDLLADGINAKGRKRMWKKVKKGVFRKTYNGPEPADVDPGCADSLPGPITVESGWRFSAHEEWKYLVLPYLENDQTRRIVRNAERARSWDAHLRGLGGMMAAAYRPVAGGGNPMYMDTLGIQSISYGYPEPARADLVVSPYGSFPLILADRGSGLAWHRATIARPKMQSPYGTVESSQAFPADGSEPQVAAIHTWDTKVTTDLAMVGGIGDIISRFFAANGLSERFATILESQQKKLLDLEGEDIPFAPPPVPPQGSEFADCSSV